MAKKEKVIKKKTISVSQKQGTFTTILHRWRGEKSKNVSELALLRNLLTNEKARILHMIKQKQPNSLYELAKLLERDFKSVRQDLTVLEKFGFVEMIPIHKGKREKLKPVLAIDSIEIKIDL
jgi:predicted transcriptional regulator